MFDEQTTAQVAAYFLQKSNKPMTRLTLLKLMYLADRQSYIECEGPITGDRVVAMGKGPVLSKTYDFIKNEGPVPSCWSDLIETRRGSSEVTLKRQVTQIDFDRLPNAIIEILDKVYTDFGDMEADALSNYTHGLEEWIDPPPGSSVTIPVRRILRALGKTPQEIDEILHSQEALAELHRKLKERSETDKIFFDKYMSTT
jgi:uncharacterized phage-associated protein